MEFKNRSRECSVLYRKKLKKYVRIIKSQVLKFVELHKIVRKQSAWNGKRKHNTKTRYGKHGVFVTRIQGKIVK
jgi:hypothetical protein